MDKIVRDVSQICPRHVLDVSQMLLSIAKSGQGELGIVTLMETAKKTSKRQYRRDILAPALESGLIERPIPDKPTSRYQTYRLTDKALKILKGNKWLWLWSLSILIIAHTPKRKSALWCSSSTWGRHQSTTTSGWSTVKSTIDLILGSMTILTISTNHFYTMTNGSSASKPCRSISIVMRDTALLIRHRSREELLRELVDQDYNVNQYKL